MNRIFCNFFLKNLFSNTFKTLLTPYILLNIVLFFFFGVLISSCGDHNRQKTIADPGSKINEPKPEIIVKEITIGRQIWAQKNLDVVAFRNGDPIIEAATDDEWEKAWTEGMPAWCYYDNDKLNGDFYGKLYNWYAVIDERGLAPQGWHIPSREDWSQLFTYVGGENEANYRLKSKIGWKQNTGTNESGFSGLPGGSRYTYGSFHSIGWSAWFWSTSEEGLVHVITVWLGNSDDNSSRWYRNCKEDGLSVRCIKNTDANTGPIPNQLPQNRNTSETKSNQKVIGLKVNDIVVANKSKVNFYSEPNSLGGTSKYILFGQEAKVIETEKDGFVKVTFTFNNKTTVGYFITKHIYKKGSDN